MRKLVLAALALSIALPAAAQQPTQPQPQQPTPQQQQPPQQQPRPDPERQVGTAGASAATVESVMDNPEQWYDKSVTLTAEVAEVIGQRAFRLQEKGMVDVDDQLLVIWPQASQRLAQDKWVKVTGKVQRFNRANIQREHSITNWSEWGFDETALGQYNDKPVLIATKVEMTEEEKK